MKRNLSLFLIAFAGLVVPSLSKATGNSPSPTVYGKLPIVYGNNDIWFWGIERLLHSFDGCKYGKIHKALPGWVHWRGTHTPEGPVSREDLEKVHSKEYLDSLSSSAVVAQVMEVGPAAWLPNWLLQLRVLTPMRWATAGTVLACQLAMEHGWAINLGGGFHHASRDRGHGFCPFADIQLGVKELRDKRCTENPKAKPLKVMIIDLDAHQGNGHGADFKDDPNTAIFDIYNKNEFPFDENAKRGITFNHPVQGGGRRACDHARHVNDAEYQALLSKELPKALEQFKPDFILYNAGTDTLDDDPLGQMLITENGIIERDAFVFQEAKNRKIPIAMVLSGGYGAQSAPAITKSICKILKIMGERAPRSVISPKPVFGKPSIKK